MTEITKQSGKREEIRKKVAASQADLAHRALPEKNPPEGIKALAMDYPFAVLLGGLALGAVAGALLPRIAGRRLAKGALAAATVAGELGLVYGRQAIEKAGDAAGTITVEGRHKLGELSGKFEGLGEAVSESAAAGYGRKAVDAAGGAAETARETGIKLARQVIKLTSHLRH